MHTDDSPIEFAVREYAGADEYDEDEERLHELGKEHECEEGFVAGFGVEDEGTFHWVQIDNERVYGNGARELFSFLYQVGFAFSEMRVRECLLQKFSGEMRVKEGYFAAESVDCSEMCMRECEFVCERASFADKCALVSEMHVRECEFECERVSIAAK